MRQSGELVSEDDCDSIDDNAPLIEKEADLDEEVDEDYTTLSIPKCLIVRRNLSIQPKIEASPLEQRENLFHTRGLSNGMPFSIIIDSGSCSDVVSTLLVQSLGLETTKHPTPYLLNWFNDGTHVKVNKQVTLKFLSSTLGS